ncbi:MAG: S41 family peptidase [Prevotellaceae bacterium]|nr:S41 family peptidase [Prevotellaceae bacterium]
MKKIILALWAILLSVTAQAQMQSELENAMRKLYTATLTTSLYYVDSVDCNKLVEDAINGMLDKLDPHSSYTNAEETKKFQEPLQGSFEGIGVQFNILDDTLIVIQPTAKGPSEKVGIMAGDRIITVDDTLIAGVKMSREDIMRRLRGPKNSQVRLGIKRHGTDGLSYFTVTRDKIPLNTVDAAYMVTPTIGLVRFTSFGQTTHDELLEAIAKLKAEGMQDLIIDLQQNGGGLLEVAADIASEFLPQGDTIVYTEGRTVPLRMFTSTGGEAFQQGKVAVLIDEYSASAAEILTGAIQDNDRGVVLGRRSFGKGLVQRPVDLPDGSMIRLTIARYYTPSGRCIQKPYTRGDRQAYSKDVIDRYNNGELTNEDSIHFPDSLRYTTRKLGRTVYGGGGIMPDYFVPLDTARYTKYYRELSVKGCIVNASLRYLDGNQKKLAKRWTSFDEFKESFDIPDDVTDKLMDEGEKLGVTPSSEEEREQTVPQLKRTLKALAARDIWDMSEYFAIVYDQDPLVLKAVELLQQ